MVKRAKWRYLVLITGCMAIVAVMFQMLGALNSTHASVTQNRCGVSCSQYDVVVIGSEIQGVLLAKEAWEQGLNVLVLDPRSKLGGELIQGQMLVLDDPRDQHGKSLVQGEMEHLYNGYRSGHIRKLADFQRYYKKLIDGIPVRSGITLEHVSLDTLNTDTSNKTIKSITYRTKDGTSYTVGAKYWVENTDFNALTGKLHGVRIPGMETIYKGKEPDYMAATYMLNFKGVKWKKLHNDILKEYPLSNVVEKYGPNTYVDWDYATGFSNLTNQYKSHSPGLKLRGLNVTYQKDGEATINGLLIFNVNPASSQSVESAVHRGRTEAPFILDFLRDNLPGFENAELNTLPDYLYIRDFNRYETKYVLDYKDVTSGRMFWDNISLGGYSIDLQGTKTIPLGIGYGKPAPYGIPLRSFMLKSYNNVIVVGKNIGASIKAYGSARIMPTTALAAQNIGIILGYELKNNKFLNELTPVDFQEIRTYLKKEYDVYLTL